MTITTTDVRPELLTEPVCRVLVDLESDRVFAQEAQGAVRSAVIELDRATAARDLSAVTAATERLRLARQAVPEPATLSPEDAIGVRDTLSTIWQTFRAASERRPTEYAAVEELGRLNQGAQLFRRCLDAFSATPSDPSHDVLALLRQASMLLTRIDAYMADHSDASTETAPFEVVEPAEFLSPHRPHRTP